MASLSSALTSQQRYDIDLSLHLPRTPANLATGNFMLDLTLLAPDAPVITSAADVLPAAWQLATNGTAAAAGVLGRARRPAILTYASPLVDTSSTLASLPWYVFGWRRESERLRVRMFEGVAFPRGPTAVPDQVRVAVEADEKMQFYETRVEVRARFSGLRCVNGHPQEERFWTDRVVQMDSLQLHPYVFRLLHHDIFLGVDELGTLGLPFLHNAGPIVHGV